MGVKVGGTDLALVDPRMSRLCVLYQEVPLRLRPGQLAMVDAHAGVGSERHLANRQRKIVRCLSPNNLQYTKPKSLTNVALL
jgi:hypothetical protein